MSPASNIAETCKLNQNVIDIRNKTDVLMKCFNTSDSNVGKNCIDCLKEFNLIANQYKQLGESPKGICFDVVDQVTKIIMNLPLNDMILFVLFFSLLLLIV